MYLSDDFHEYEQVCSVSFFIYIYTYIHKQTFGLVILLVQLLVQKVKLEKYRILIRI